MRSQAAIRGNFFAPCIPRRPGRESAPPWQDLRAPCIRNELALARYAPCIRKAPQIAFWECIARRSCQEGGPFRCTDPSNHARRANLAIRRRRTARAASTHGTALMTRHAYLAIRRRRSSLALATPAPPNSASRPQPRRRPHSAAAFGTRHPTQRQTARALATSVPPNGAKPPATATPKRNSRANGMDWLHYVGRFCENRESAEDRAELKMPTFWQKRTLKKKN